jgi:predicted PurR-regulated permease PerM
MFTTLITVLTTGLFVLFVIVLISTVVYSLSSAFREIDKEPQTSSTFLSALLNQFRVLGGRYDSIPSNRRNERDN